MFLTQHTQNICITFGQRRSNVIDAGLTLYKCYTLYKCFVKSSAAPLKRRHIRNIHVVTTRTQDTNRGLQRFRENCHRMWECENICCRQSVVCDTEISWHTHDIRMKYVLHTHAYAQHTRGICMAYARHTHDIDITYAWHTHAIRVHTHYKHMAYSCHTYGI